MPSLFDSWKRLFDRPAAATHARAEEIRVWQKTLLEEHEQLRDELELLLRTYVRTIDHFAERANQLTEEQFLQEQESIESIRKILQNAIRRLEVSSKDHRELLDEWHEWVAFRRAAGQKHELPAAHQLRVEMIRSELTVRGIQVEQPVSQMGKESQASLSVEEERREASSIQSQSPYRPAPLLDELADWMELRQVQIEPEHAEAERAWKELSHEAHAFPEQALLALKRLKEAHGDLRLLDRARRERRDRLAIFHTNQ
ncbi:hypothetical protein KBD34_00075 [Patescibacteria group bacterium]|nr:hypothetical protein [Patescibacteria group bacterium]